MFSALSKTIAAGIIAAALVSCGDSAADGARALYGQSEAAIAQGRYAEAIEFLDTLNSRYYEQTEVRREALGLRARAMEGIAIDSIQVLDGELAQWTMTVQELEPQFRHVPAPAPGMDGYWLPTGVDEHVMGATGVQARVSDEGYLYIVANVQGRKIGIRALRLCDGADQCVSADISPARVITVRGSESASFSPEEIGEFGPWLASHPGASKLVIVGSRGDANVRLTPALRNEISRCAAYSTAILSQRSATIRREKFERMLATARDQIANFAIPEQQQ